MRYVTFFAPALTVLGLASVSTAAEIHVDGCAGGGDGSVGNPFCSVQAGLAAAEPGDTVVVRPGDYDEVVETQRDGTASAPITLRGASAGAVVIRSPGRVLRIFHPHHAWLILRRRRSA